MAGTSPGPRGSRGQTLHRPTGAPGATRCTDCPPPPSSLWQGLGQTQGARMQTQGGPGRLPDGSCPVGSGPTGHSLCSSCSLSPLSEEHRTGGRQGEAGGFLSMALLTDRTRFVQAGKLGLQSVADPGPEAEPPCPPPSKHTPGRPQGRGCLQKPRRASTPGPPTLRPARRVQDHVLIGEERHAGFLTSCRTAPAAREAQNHGT